MPSGNLSDSKAAIPLLKKVNDLMPTHFTTAIFDASYDYEAIYRQALNQTIRVVIPYNVRREGEMIGFDAHISVQLVYVNIATVMTATMRSIRH